ncbi:MAG: helix-turn-helix domain-containing protein, partial [Atopostipes suicloacalis]|nr:helix-turn-helix domain-containing protein [Atopostipes suicloacalis]
CFNKKNVQYDLRGFTECFVAQILEWNKLLLEGDHQVLNLISFMMENLDKDLTLSDFCEMFNISQTKLQKMFQDAVDISPINFFNQLKYQKAKQLVIESDFSIANIAEKLGFENTRYFSVFFGKFERISPLEMRKLYHYLRGGEELMKENISLRFFNQIDRTLYELDQLIQLLNMMKRNSKDIQNEETSHSLEKNFLKIESIYQQYMDQKYKTIRSNKNSYQDLAPKISSLLKESDVPLSTKEIYTQLMENNSLSLSYGNFCSNILARMNKDSTFNVEKVKRGYWQYRLIN